MLLLKHQKKRDFVVGSTDFCIISMSKNIKDFFAPKESKKDKKEGTADLMAKDLDPIEQFAEGLGSWKEPLQNFIKSKTFQDIYKFIK